MSQKTEIVHIMSSLNVGGVSTFVLHLIRELNRQNIKNHVILTLDKGEVYESYLKENVEIHICYQRYQFKSFLSYSISKIFRNSAKYTFFFRLAFLLKKINPKVVHSHLHGSQWISQTLAAKLAGLPLILHMHSPSSLEIKKWRVQKILPKVMGKSSFFNIPSDGIFEAYNVLLNKNKSQILRLPYGIPFVKADTKRVNSIRKQFNLPKNGKVIGYIGRIIDHKRIEDLLYSVKPLISNKKDLRVFIIGEGGQRKKYEEMNKSLGLNEQVYFIGYQDDPHNWMSIIDILVLPSLFEGFPICVIESMAYGAVSIGSDVPGTRDAIKDGITGLLFPLKNTSELYSKINLLLENPELIKKFNRKAKKEFLANHEIGICAGKYLKVYDSISNSK